MAAGSRSSSRASSPSGSSPTSASRIGSTGAERRRLDEQADDPRRTRSFKTPAAGWRGWSSASSGCGRRCGRPSAVLGSFRRPVAVRPVASPAAAGCIRPARWLSRPARAGPCGGRGRPCGWPSRDAGLARLEQDSGVTHQPLRALDDHAARRTSPIPATQRLWALHRQRLIAEPRAAAAGAAALRPAAPRPLGACGRRCCWCWSWRWSTLAARSARAWSVASPSPAGPPWAASPPAVDLWITPPAYTRRAPLVSEQTRGVAALAVPSGSEARVQAHHLADGSAAAVVLGEAGRCRSKPWGRAVAKPS